MDWTPGGHLGRFELERRLGKGAFAEVWLASEKGALGFSRRVALKQLRANRDEVQHRQDLLNEARLCAHLSHPNVISVIAVEEDDDNLVVVMEYLDGGSLGDLLGFAAEHGLRLPRSAIVDLSSQLAAGLRYAHEALGADDRPMGLVHRDLKPANVLLGRSGVAKIADFGIAKAQEDTSNTATGTLKGTVAYVAPEILRGARSFAPCVDLFALGCMLYEIVLIERLFNGEVPATVMFQIVSGDPREELEEMREVYPEMASILDGLLQRDPDRRTPSARVVLEALQPLVAHERAGGDVGHLVDIRRLIESDEAPKGLRIPRAADPDWRAWMELAATREPRYAAALEPAPPAPVRAAVPRVAEPETLRPPAKVHDPRRKSHPASARPRTSPGRPRTRGDARPARRPWAAVVGLLALLLVALLAFLLRPAPDAITQAPAETAAATPEDTFPVLPIAAPRNTLPDLPVAAPQNTRPDLPVAAPQNTRPDLPIAGAGAGDPTGPTPHPRDPAIGEAAAVPTPQVVEAAPTPAPAATPATITSEACLILTSRPGGARVWLNGEARTTRASSKMGSRLSRRAGSLTVGMGMTAQTVSTTVTLTAGQATQVSCDLMGSARCSTTVVSMAVCE